MYKYKYGLLISFVLCLLSINAKTHKNKIEINLRLMTFNIRNGMSMGGIINYENTAAVITKASPDVVALQEIDSVTARSHGKDVLQILARYTHLYPTYGAAIRFQNGKYGIGILSKEIPLSVKHFSLPGKEEGRTLLIAEFKNYVVFATHFSLNQHDRLKSVSIINRLSHRHFNKPIFFMGDLNCEPKSPAIKRISKKWIQLNIPQEASYPANKPVYKIDYIFIHKKSKYRIYIEKYYVVPNSVVSDHRPIMVQISLKNR